MLKTTQSKTGSRRLLYYSPSYYGGLADYAREQAQALVEAGVEVDFLTTSEFKPRQQDRYRVLPNLKSKSEPKSASRLKRRMATVQHILGNARALANSVRMLGCQHVLCGAYAEYLAPLWAGRLRALAKAGVTFGTIVHDPVRDAVIGPLWWHKWSISSGYSFVREAFVHEPVQLNAFGAPVGFRTTVIPHGTFALPPATNSRAEVRHRLAIPCDARVLLAFGHVRDNKNLHLALQALASLQDFYLIVAGKELSDTQKPMAFYRELAAGLGVADRCRWINNFIPEAEIGDYFTAADLVLLTYSSSFRSASGVLNFAVAYRKPCIASAGRSNLESVVKEYQLGAWVDPDSVESLATGLAQWSNRPPTPQWDRYERENSWAVNAKLVVEKIFERSL